MTAMLPLRTSTRLDGRGRDWCAPRRPVSQGTVSDTRIELAVA